MRVLVLLLLCVKLGSCAMPEDSPYTDQDKILDSLDLEDQIDTYAQIKEDKRVSRVADHVEIASKAGVDPTLTLDDKDDDPELGESAMTTTQSLQNLYETTKAHDEQIDSAILGKMRISDMYTESEMDRVQQALKKWRVDAYKPYDENPVVH